MRRYFISFLLPVLFLLAYEVSDLPRLGTGPGLAGRDLKSII